MELIAVAAVAENGVIGADGELPWPSIDADKRAYRDRVAGHPVILGRRTYESMRDDLPGDRQVVLSRDEERSYPEESAHVRHSVEEAIDFLEAAGAEKAFVLGGGAVYAAFFPYLDRLRISRIPAEFAGDTVFPEIDPGDWALVDREGGEGYTLERWRRKGHPPGRSPR